MNISLCMIVKNEEENICTCLDSIADLVEEVIIVDTGSTDKTKDLVLKYDNVKLYDFEWIYDFAAARNFAFSKATKDYQMWLDADEVLFDIDRERFIELRKRINKEKPDKVSCFNIMTGGGAGNKLKFRRNRIVKRANNFQWKGVVHEFIDASGRTIDSNVEITHTKSHNGTGRNLDIFERQEAQGMEFNTRDLTYYGRELCWNRKYEKSIEIFNKFFEREDAWIEDILTSIRLCSNCYLYTNQTQKAKEMLMKSFTLTAPRGEIMYSLASIFQNEGNIDAAISWYKMILTLEIPDTYGFVELSDWTWRPALQLTKLLWEKGKKEESLKYHNIAYKFNHTDKSILFNEEFFGYPNRKPMK